MTHSHHRHLILGACVALVGTVTLATPSEVRAQAGLPAGPNVRVVNTPDTPIPVTLGGPVAIDTSAPLPVSVVTTAPLPVTVVGASAPQPFHVSFFIPNGTGAPPRFVVPAGKRFVVEDASCAGTDANDTLLGLSISTTVAGANTVHLCPFDVRVNLGIMSYRGARPMRIYADPGTTVTVNFDGQGVGPGALLSATLSGQLVDVP